MSEGKDVGLNLTNAFEYFKGVEVFAKTGTLKDSKDKNDTSQIGISYYEVEK